jgi:hypothetical protein
VRPGRRSLVVIAVILVAAIGFGAVELGRSGTRASAAGPPGPTLADPLADAQQTTMAAARSALGVSIPLPSTSSVQPADVGAVWETGGTQTIVALTYPAKGLIIYYTRPAIEGHHPTKWLQREAAQLKAKVVQLHGTTQALVVAQNSDSTGANSGVVAFVVNGTEVQVRGHTDEASLEAIAQSILARSPV